MSEPYIGEIRLVGFNFAPLDWAFCNGQLIPISENTTLFTLIGTTYGGDGVNTFALPNLQSRVAIHMGTGGGQTYIIGQTGGAENVTLTTNQIPAHVHGITAQGGEGNASSPVNNYFAASSSDQYATSATGTTGSMLNISGGSLPHSNIQPFLTLNYIIALFGVFPSQS